MLAGPDRDLDAGHGPHLAAPQPGAECDGVAAHRAAVRLDAGDPPAAGQDAGYAGVLVDPQTRDPEVNGTGAPPGSAG